MQDKIKAEDQDIKIKSQDIKLKIKIQDYKHTEGLSKEFPRTQGSKVQDITRSKAEIEQLMKGNENVDTNEFMDEILKNQEYLDTRLEPKSDKEILEVNKRAYILIIHDDDEEEESGSFSMRRNSAEEVAELILSQSSLSGFQMFGISFVYSERGQHFGNQDQSILLRRSDLWRDVKKIIYGDIIHATLTFNHFTRHVEDNSTSLGKLLAFPCYSSLSSGIGPRYEPMVNENQPFVTYVEDQKLKILEEVHKVLDGNVAGLLIATSPAENKKEEHVTKDEEVSTNYCYAFNIHKHGLVSPVKELWKLIRIQANWDATTTTAITTGFTSTNSKQRPLIARLGRLIVLERNTEVGSKNMLLRSKG
nr:probable sucrose-phosphate synthase 1 [Tanacetum cinerariifolium]